MFLTASLGWTAFMVVEILRSAWRDMQRDYGVSRLRRFSATMLCRFIMRLTWRSVCAVPPAVAGWLNAMPRSVGALPWECWALARFSFWVFLLLIGAYLNNVPAGPPSGQGLEAADARFLAAVVWRGAWRFANVWWRYLRREKLARFLFRVFA